MSRTMSAVLHQPGYSIRNMERADIDAVMQIERAVYPFPWTKQIFNDCIRVGYVCRMFVDKERIIAYSIISIGAGEAHILNLCVDPGWQRQGLAQALLKDLMGVAKEKHVNSVFLEVRPSNDRAISLYEKLGFNRVGTRTDYYPAHNGREDAVIFALDLF